MTVKKREMTNRLHGLENELRSATTGLEDMRAEAVVLHASVILGMATAKELADHLAITDCVDASLQRTAAALARTRKIINDRN